MGRRQRVSINDETETPTNLMKSRRERAMHHLRLISGRYQILDAI
jgi:hypothetical protein